MTLGEKQRVFTLMVARLIAWAYQNGYELTFGDAYRDPRVHGPSGDRKPGSYSSPYSNHKLRLAIDLNLFKDGVYLTTDEDHAPLHAFWESIGGGARIPGDANHYSLEHEGRR